MEYLISQKILKAYKFLWVNLMQYKYAQRAMKLFLPHRAFTHYLGIAEKYEDLFPEVRSYFSSFFSYWKKFEKYLKPVLTINIFIFAKI